MTGLERAIRDFCDRSEVAPATRRFYEDALLRPFLPWALEAGLTEPGRLDVDVVERYARDLEQRISKRGIPLALASRRAYLRGLRQLLGWLKSRRGLEVATARSVPMPRLRKVQRDVLTPRELQQLEDAAPIERDKLIVAVMAETGAREGEVAAIRIPDVIQRERRHHYLRLRGKTGERLSTITPGLWRRLQEYAQGKAGRPMLPHHEQLFMAHRRRAGGGYEPLTESGVYKVIKDAAERSGLQRRIYPHLLRHSALTRMVNAGVNLSTIADNTGVSIEVIARHYAHQSDEDRHDAILRALTGQ